MTLEVACATASLTRGTLEATSADAAAREQLQELAATLPDLFGTLELDCLMRIAQRLGADASGEEPLELLLLSEQCIQVVHQLRDQPGLALVAISRSVGKIGLVLSEVHAAVARLEGGP